MLPDILTNPDPYIYEGDNYVVLDFETTTHDKGSPYNPDNRIVLAVWRCGPAHPRRSDRGEDDVNQVVWGGEFDLGTLIADIQDAEFLVAHNAKFELGWLERCGLDLSTVVVFDTMLAEYVRGGNRYAHAQVSLESCAQRYFKVGKISIVSKMIKAQMCTTEIPSSWLEDYCIQDVELTHRLFLEQRKVLADRELLPVLYTRCLVATVLAAIEKNGMQLDSDRVSALAEQKEREYAAAEREITEFVEGINVNSRPQLREYLYETLGFDEVKTKQGGRWVPLRTPKGAKSTAADVVQQLKATTDKQRAFLALFTGYQELYSELTKYLRKFRDCARDAGGRLTASFNQTSTRTHRLSSSGREYKTQFQNFPRAYKSLFKARHPGWKVGECDGATLEFRIAAHLGRDGVALGDIVGGIDVHSVTADVIGCTRTAAKAHTFKPLYGGSSGTPEQRAYYDYFKEKYQGVADAQRSWINEVLDNKCLRTEWGLTFYWPDTRMDRSGYVTNTTSICNYPVQSLATAEIIPIALRFMWQRIHAEGLRMIIVNTIHDSIIVEVPPDEIDDFTRLSRQCLIDDVYPYLEQVYGIKLSVPLGCGVSVSDNWSEGEEEKYEASAELY